MGTPRLWEAPALVQPPPAWVVGAPPSPMGPPPAVPAPPWGAWVEPHGGEVRAPPKKWGPPPPAAGVSQTGGVPQSRVRTPKWSGCPKTGCAPQSRGGTPVPQTLPAPGTGISGAPQTTIKNWGSSGALSFVLPELPRAHRGVRGPTKQGGGSPKKIGRSPLPSPRAPGAGVTQEGTRTPPAAEARAQTTAPSPWQTQPSPLYFFGGEKRGENTHADRRGPGATLGVGSLPPALILLFGHATQFKLNQWNICARPSPG